MTASIITNYVADIVGHTVSESWIRHFKAHHLDEGEVVIYVGEVPSSISESHSHE